MGEASWRCTHPLGTHASCVSGGSLHAQAKDRRFPVLGQIRAIFGCAAPDFGAHYGFGCPGAFLGAETRGIIVG
jgi:hypothetical protein